MSKHNRTEEENLRIVKSAIEAYNAHDIGRVIDCEAESIIHYSPHSPKRPCRSRVGDIINKGRFRGLSRHSIQGRPEHWAKSIGLACTEPNWNQYRALRDREGQN